MNSKCFPLLLLATAVAFLCVAFVQPGLARGERVVIDVGGESKEVTQEQARFESTDDGGFTSRDAGMQVTMPADVGAQAIHIENPQHEATLRIEQLAAVQRDDNGEVLERYTPSNTPAERLDDVTVRYRDVYPHTDDEYILSYGKLKHDWVLTRQPTLPVAAAWYGYDVRLTLPANATLEEDGHELVVLDEAGDALFTLPRVVAHDAAGREQYGQYRILSHDGRDLRLGVEIPAAWLATASYPVRIDPTVITITSSNTTLNSWPFGSGEFSYQQSYSAAQLQNTAGDIDRIGFEFNSTSKTWPRARIYIGETSRDSNTFSYTYDTNFDIVSATLVYDDELQISGSGFQMIDLQTPYAYSGQETLLLLFRLDSPSGSGGRAIREMGGGPVECFRLWDNGDADATGHGMTGMTSLENYFLHARFEILTQPTNPPEIDTNSLPDGMENQPYSETLQASSGTPPYSWSESGLPAGLSLNASSGEISGTPDANDVGTHTVTITVTDDAGLTDDETFTFEIEPAVEITTSSLPSGVEGFAYTEQVQASGGTTPYSWSASGLPSSLSIDASSGEISGTPAIGDAGTHSVTVTVTDDNSDTDDTTLSLEIGPAASVDPVEFPPGTETGPYPSVTATASDGLGPFTWSAPGLPGGLSIDPNSGEISGTLDSGTAGSHTVDVTVTDDNGHTDTYEATLVVNPTPQITTAQMPRITPGYEWGPHPIEHEGGTPDFVWSAEGLPEGLEFDTATGEISGTVAAGVIEGSMTFEATVTDTYGVQHNREVELRTRGLNTGDGGCDCRATAAGSGSHTVAWLLALMLMVLVHGRRRLLPTG